MNFVLFAVPSFANNPVSSARQKTVIENNYQPYSFLNQKGEADGFSINILKAVSQALNIELDIRADNWGLAMKELAAGQIDLIPIMAYSEERKNFFDYSVPYTVVYGRLVKELKLLLIF